MQNQVGATKPLREAFVDWIEARLPADKSGLSVGAPFLESVMLAELKSAGLTAPDDDAEARFGSLGLALTWLEELPDVLFVTAGVGVHCGEDDAVYMYRFDPRGRVRLLADHPKSEWGYYGADIQISEPDTDRRRLLLLRYQSVQCASARNQGFYLRPDGNLFVLEPNRLTIEFANRSVDMFVHNRTFLQRFDFSHGAERIAPLALNPRDFAEEWLTNPWKDVRAWSTPDTRDAHSKFSNDYVGGEFSTMGPCGRTPGRWLIGLNLRQVGEKELPAPQPIYLIVRDLGAYRYRMEYAGPAPPKACPAGAEPDVSPGADLWLDRAAIKALP